MVPEVDNPRLICGWETLGGSFYRSLPTTGFFEFGPGTTLVVRAAHGIHGLVDARRWFLISDADGLLSGSMIDRKSCWLCIMPFLVMRNKDWQGPTEVQIFTVDYGLLQKKQTAKDLTGLVRLLRSAIWFFRAWPVLLAFPQDLNPTWQERLNITFGYLWYVHLGVKDEEELATYHHKNRGCINPNPATTTKNA